jgi:hypothetical protein
MAFGLLYFFSYLMANLFYYGMAVSAFYAAGASGTATGILLLPGFLLPLAVLGTLMVLSVYRRWAFHVLATYVLAIQAFCVVEAVLMPLSDFFGNVSSSLISFCGSSNMLLMLLWQLSLSDAAVSLLNLLLWILPFAVYYTLRLFAGRSGGTPEAANETPPAQEPPAEPTN